MELKIYHPTIKDLKKIPIGTKIKYKILDQFPVYDSKMSEKLRNNLLLDWVKYVNSDSNKGLDSVLGIWNKDKQLQDYCEESDKTFLEGLDSELKFLILNDRKEKISWNKLLDKMFPKTKKKK